MVYSILLLSLSLSLSFTRSLFLLVFLQYVQAVRRALLHLLVLLECAERPRARRPAGRWRRRGDSPGQIRGLGAVRQSLAGVQGQERRVLQEGSGPVGEDIPAHQGLRRVL